MFEAIDASTGSWNLAAPFVATISYHFFGKLRPKPKAPFESKSKSKTLIIIIKLIL
jgi:hypothetical protein